MPLFDAIGQACVAPVLDRVKQRAYLVELQCSHDGTESYSGEADPSGAKLGAAFQIGLTGERAGSGGWI